MSRYISELIFRISLSFLHSLSGRFINRIERFIEVVRKKDKENEELISALIQVKRGLEKLQTKLRKTTEELI